jgi:hypothetical protein
LGISDVCGKIFFLVIKDLKEDFFVKYHIDVCRFKNMNKILGSVKKKCIFVIYRRAFLKVGKNDVGSNILLL